MPAALRIRGLRETIRDLERLGVDVADLKEAFGAISRDVAEEAGGLVRRLSGALANTIRPAKTKNRAIVRVGTARVRYAGPMNYGWPAHGIAGDGFLTTPANTNLDAKRDRIITNLDQLITRRNLT